HPSQAVDSVEDTGGDPAQEANPPLLLHPQQRSVPLVAAKQFVPAVAGQSHLDVPSGFSRQKVSRNSRCVPKWFVINGLHAQQLLCNVDVLCRKLRVAGAIGFRDGTGIGDLTMITIEVERKRPEVSREPARYQANGAGIEAAAEKGADRYISDQLPRHGALEQSSKLFYRFVRTNVAVDLWRRPVAPHLYMAVAIGQ